MAVLGLDTSNYTTSVAVFDGKDGLNLSQLLTVRLGELGLRQSDALFQHVKNLPHLFEQMNEMGLLHSLKAVGASTTPCRVQGSYMPCFLAGESQGRSLAHSLGVPFFAHSHQEGHLAAAAWSAGQIELLEQPFLAWHLSGGTTQLLLVQPEQGNLNCQVVGGTQDISAGQLIDRTGVLLGLQFPAGKALDTLYTQADSCIEFPVKLNELNFSLSGMENKVKGLLEQGEKPANIARFTLDTVIGVVVRATQQAQKRWPGLRVLCSGGVASNTQLRNALSQRCQAVFAQPQYATDNAMGVAILTWNELYRQGAQ